MILAMEVIPIDSPPKQNYWAGNMIMPDGEMVAVRTTLQNAGEVYSYFKIGDQWYYVHADLRCSEVALRK